MSHSFLKINKKKFFQRGDFLTTVLIKSYKKITLRSGSKLAQHSESGPRSARAAPYIHLLGVVGLGHLDQSAVPLVLQDLDAHHVTVRTKHVEYGRYIRYLKCKVYKFLLTTGNRKIFFSAFKDINKIFKKYRNEPKQKSSNQSRCVIT